MEENGIEPKNNVRNFYFPSNSWLHVFMLPRWKVMTQKVTSWSKNRKGIVKHEGEPRGKKINANCIQISHTEQRECFCLKFMVQLLELVNEIFIWFLKIRQFIFNELGSMFLLRYLTVLLCFHDLTVDAKFMWHQ